MRELKCANVASYMGPYAANYIHSALFLEKKVRENGGKMIHVFPEEVKEMDWVKLFEEMDAKLYFIKFAPYSIDNIKQLRKIFKQENINIIHSHFSGWDLTVKFAAPFIPVVWHERMSINIVDRKKRIKNWIKFNIIGIYNTFSIGVSNEVYNQIATLTNGKRCGVIPDAIKFERLNNSYKKNQNKPYKVLMFGWSPLIKGVDIAYKACELLNNEENVVELNVVALEETKKYIAEHCSPQPEWLRILTPTDEIYRYYDEADVFLSASRSEAFSNALLEAIYSGRPAVISDIKTTNWALEFNNTFQYAVESPEALARTIETCINTAFTEESVRRNVQIAIEKYSMGAWAENVLDVLKKNKK